MKKGRRGGANGAGIARKADRVHRLKHQLRASVAGGKQEKPRDRNRSAITGTYTGFCPWKERPEGGRLPEIDRVLVNEYIECCSNCSSNSSASSTTSRSEGSTEAAASGSGSSALCRACFFGLYIKPRKPCLLRLVREDKPKNCKQESEALADARALRQWRDLNYLKQTAGNETIDVEIRGTQGAPSFGKGQYQQLPFGEVLQRLQDGDSSLYVTTQRIPSDKYGPKAVCGAPLNGSLAGDFPQSPALAGHLVVSQFNIWMGHSYHGSSTGLHHDFHDNFYCLLRGRKEFRLYSPRLCRLLRPQGCMRMTNSPAIHSNGLISYIPCIREDGAHEGAVLRARQIALEETIRELQEELQSTQARLEAAAEAVEHRDAKRALEDKLNQAEAELDECLEAALTAAGEDSGFEDGDSTTSEEGDGRLVKEGEIPNHFCLKDTRPCGASSWEGPLTAANCLERFWSVWVTEGDILYLPASWFHEVISYSGEKGAAANSSEDSQQTIDPVHLAFNIWLHPPASEGTYEHPYCDSFWAQHAAQLKQKTH